MSNRVSFELSASNTFLSDLFEEMLDEAVSSEPLEVNSVEIILKRIGEAELRPQGKSIHIFLPLNIQLRRSAGLFTAEGSGSINLHLVVNYDIDERLQLKAKSDLVAHEWLEKPVLEIGALNIPVETLVNMVIRHHESIITAKIDASLRDFSNLQGFVLKGLENAKLSLAKQDLKGNALDFNVHRLSLTTPIINDELIFIKGFLYPTIGINSRKQQQQESITFNWLDQNIINEKSQIGIDIELPYDLLELEMKNALRDVEVGGKRFDVRSMQIRGVERLNVDLDIDQPIKAQIFIQGNPMYNEIEGQLFVDELDVKVNPANFIYKLTAPLVNSFIENKMEEFFPLDINSQLKELVREKIPNTIDIPNGSIQLNHESLTIAAMNFEQDRIVGHAIIDDFKVVVRRL